MIEALLKLLEIALGSIGLAILVFGGPFIWLGCLSMPKPQQDEDQDDAMR